MDELIIAGLAAYATQIAKGYGLPKKFFAIAIMLFTIIFAFIGAFIYTPDDTWREIVQKAIILGAMTSGIYGLGKAAKERPPADPFEGRPEVTE